MEDKLNILLLDCNEVRLHTTTSFINCCDEGKYCIDPRPSVDQYTFENNNYDIVLAHYGNEEVEESIADGDWNSGDAVIIFFSGYFDKDKEEYKGVWWVSASYLEKKKNICILLNEVCRQ
mgnify:CR=1 FL=1